MLDKRINSKINNVITSKKTTNIKPSQVNNKIRLNAKKIYINDKNKKDRVNAEKSSGSILVDTEDIKDIGIKPISAARIQTNTNKSEDLRKNINPIKDHSSNVIQTRVNKNKFNKLQTGKVGVLKKIRTDDNTSNLAINSIADTSEKADKVIDESKNIVHAYKHVKNNSKNIKTIIGKGEKEDKLRAKDILKGDVKLSIKNISKSGVDNAIQRLKTDDSTDNLTFNSLNQSIEYGRKLSNGIKKTINSTISIANFTSKHKQKGIITLKKRSISTKQKRELKLQRRSINIAKKTVFQRKAKLMNAKKIIDNFGIIKDAVTVAFKSKGILMGTFFIAIGLSFIMLINSVSAICSTVTLTPNIDDSQKWINMMDTIDKETNNKLHSGNKLEIKNSEKKCDWKSVIAVAMAKYENDPPSFDESISGNSENINTETTTSTTFTGTYQDVINAASSATGVDACLIAAVIKQESDFNPLSTSQCGAMGLMQMMPETAAQYGVLNGYDPYQNVMGGSRLLAELLGMYNGDLTLTLAAYNAGSGNVAKYGGVPPFGETQQYIVKVQAYYQAYKNGEILPDGQITGVMNMGSGGINNFLSQIYSEFNKVTKRTETKTETKTDSEGNAVTNKKTITIYTLTFSNADEVMERLNFTDSQKDMAKGMIESDTFSEIIPDFDFKFKLNIPSSGSITTGSDIGTLSPGNIQTTSQTRKAVIETAMQLVDKVSYFWGGKSNPGWNDQWGQPAVVTAGGSPSTGTTRPYGLDCSGFVGWVYETAGITNQLQGSTFTERDASYEIQESELKPGDLVFYPDYSHVGIYEGEGDNGHIYIECCSSKGVAVTSGRGFTIFRRPYINFEGDE